MNADEFERLIKERDAELGTLSGWYDPPTAFQRLYEGKPVKLFNGSVASRVEVLENFTASYDGTKDNDSGWGGADGEVMIVEVTDPTGLGKHFFKVTGYYDSWDNGDPDVFKATEIVKVEKATVVTWKEVK